MKRNLKTLAGVYTHTGSLVKEKFDIIYNAKTYIFIGLFVVHKKECLYE